MPALCRRGHSALHNEAGTDGRVRLMLRANSETIMAHPIPEVLQAFASGEIVVVTDDDDREGEGDLIVAASLCTAEKVTSGRAHTSHTDCAPIPARDACSTP